MIYERWFQLSAIAALAILVACTAPPPTTPSTPPPAPTTASPPQATVASTQTTINGTVDTITGNTLSISTNTGDRDVQLAENAQIDQQGKGVLADLQPGLAVAITGKPDGSNVTAVSIRLFPPALGTPRPGQFPMSGANAGNLMTNAVIKAFDGSTLTVEAAGQQFLIGVPASTEILKQVPAAINDLTPGERVVATLSPAPDGSLRANSVSIVGGPG